MSIEPVFSGEVQFRRYSDTSTQGQQIVLQVEDRESLRPFIGLEGKRFMAVLVAIGDDEQPSGATAARIEASQGASMTHQKDDMDTASKPDAAPAPILWAPPPAGDRALRPPGPSRKASRRFALRSLAHPISQQRTRHEHN
jgi:hypothetical protein